MSGARGCRAQCGLLGVALLRGCAFFGVLADSAQASTQKWNRGLNARGLVADEGNYRRCLCARRLDESLRIPVSVAVAGWVK